MSELSCSYGDNHFLLRVYLNSYRDVRECKEWLGSFFDRYNNLREHQSLDYNYPAEIYFKEIEMKKKAD